jgi:hypothetical protein
VSGQLYATTAGYRSRGLGSISIAARFSEKKWVFERGSLSLMSTIEELLERKSSCSGLENGIYSLRDPPH